MNSKIFAIDPNTPPKLTDWIQAIGAIVAVVAAIFGFIKLFIRDKKRETEIKSLTTIAQAQQENLQKVEALLGESRKQTLEFSIQTSEMQETNKLYRNHILLLSQAMTDTKAHRDQLILLQKEQRKNEILPRFKISTWNHFQQNIGLQFQLVRNHAYFEEFKNLPDTGLVYQPQILKNKLIGTNETISINGMITGPFAILTNYQQTPLPVAELVYRNEDNDLYRQVITRAAMGFDISKPEAIS